ncbi:unnamed protein product [Dovyalis caffra]|uniref:Uncharacterized protein n=1 Tax=Dovyalis caffra TaxID=77055 RepID=A0AAV1SSN4_9ROSI|nr:unnamed protein product [Dovyalis caffra]
MFRLESATSDLAGKSLFKNLDTRLRIILSLYQLLDLAGSIEIRLLRARNRVSHMDLTPDPFLEVSIAVTFFRKKGNKMLKSTSEDRELNSTIMVALNSNKLANSVDLSQEYFYYYDEIDDDVKVLDFMPQFTLSKQKEPIFGDSIIENGQSSNSQIDPILFVKSMLNP